MLIMKKEKATILMNIVRAFWLFFLSVYISQASEQRWDRDGSKVLGVGEFWPILAEIRIFGDSGGKYDTWILIVTLPWSQILIAMARFRAFISTRESSELSQSLFVC